MCKLTRTQPSFLLHPLDLIGSDHVPALAFFPGMNIQSTRKLKIFKLTIEILKKNFELLTMSEFAQRIGSDLRGRKIKTN